MTTEQPQSRFGQPGQCLVLRRCPASDRLDYVRIHQCWRVRGHKGSCRFRRCAECRLYEPQEIVLTEPIWPKETTA